MTVQNELDMQEKAKPKVLEALVDGPLAPTELCEAVGGFHYITKRAVWSLVLEDKVKFDSQNKVTIA